MWWLGEISYHGYYGDVDHETAEKWYKKAAELGNADAQNALEKYYKKGTEVPEDKELVLE